jgi:hypothetical protein
MYPQCPERNVELDIIKGALVLVMLFYHCASISSFSSLYIVMQRIHFIHYAFLSITGFLCGYHYYPVNPSTHRKVRVRLLSRSARLFAIFLCGNIACQGLGIQNADGGSVQVRWSVAAWLEELLFRVPDVALEILYLIAVFLFIATLVIGLSRAKWFLSTVIILSAVVNSQPLLFMAFGCAGMLVGMLSKDGHLLRVRSWVLLHLWVFPLALVPVVALAPIPDRWTAGTNGALLFHGLVTPLWFFSALWAVRWMGCRRVQDAVVLLGRYTLPAYILQMVFARITYNVLYRIGLKDFAYYGISLVIVGMATWQAVVIVHRLRASSALWDHAYRAVFQ